MNNINSNKKEGGICLPFLKIKQKATDRNAVHSLNVIGKNVAKQIPLKDHFTVIASR
ncbi:hypothetical protein [uncultured Anaerofustis sp.]|uniref:hypothetical protein n=1 Tax=uncultured Anaerofustis sp. TaxID=904996 RepID=UPI0025D5C34C|nr:hypothetical protein [uncultured Anaerofustis sp.]